MKKGRLVSFLLGLGVGIGVGILFAPRSGTETREIIKSKAGEGTDFAKQRGSDFNQTAREWVDKGKDALGRQKDNLADAMEAGKRAYRDTHFEFVRPEKPYPPLSPPPKPREGG